MATSETEPLLETIRQPIYSDGGEKSTNGKNDPPPDPEKDKSIFEILSSFFHIFSMATGWDKFLIFLALLFTFAHGLCFLGFAKILGNMTEPFIQQSIYGYSNGTVENTNFREKNTSTSTGLFTKSEFTNEMEEYSVFLFIIAGVVFLVSFLQTSLWELSAENMCYHFRGKFAEQVLRRKIDWFTDNKPDPLCVTLTDSVEKMREGIGHKLSMVLQYATICGVQVTFALLTNWQLTMIFLTISPLPVLLAKFLNFGKLLAKKGQTEQEKYAKAASQVTQILENVRRVFTWGKENYEIERYSASLHDAANTAVNKYLVQSIGVGVFLVLLMGSYAVAFRHACGDLEESAIAHLHACSCSNLQDHTTSLKDIYMVFFTVTIAVFSLGQILPWITTIASAQGSSVALEEILTLPDPDIDASRSKKDDLPTLTGSLMFKDVTFSYPASPKEMILQDLDLKINPGSTVGIIGNHFSGKSTIINLLFRFYDPRIGNIFVDNVDIKNIDLAGYRSKVGVLPQSDIEFMDGTIMDNIQAGQDISEDKVIQTAKLLNAHSFISNLDKKYETEVGEIDWNAIPTIKLYIAIVRAMVRDPAWLIFDDKLSSIPDFPGFVEKIRQARKDLVTVYVACDTDMMKNMDIVHFVEHGKIMETGTFDELMKLKGRFWRMYEDQHESTTPAMGPGRSAPYMVQYVQIDKDDLLVAKIVEHAKLDRKYPGFWKIIKMTNYTFTDWSLWGLAGIGCLLSGLVIPLFSNYYTDIFSAFGNTSAGLPNDSTFWTYMLFGLAGMAGVGFCMRSLFVQVAGEFMVLRLRTLSLMSIMARPISWFDKTENTATNLSNKLEDGVPAIKAALDNRFSIAFSGLFSIFAAILIALILGWQFGVGIITCVLIIVGLMAFQIYYQRESQRISHDLLAKSNSIFKQAVQQIKTIQYLCREPGIKRTYGKIIHGNLVDRWVSCTIFAFMHALSETLVYILLGSALWYGAYLIDVDAMEPIVVFRIFLILAFCMITFEHTTSFIPDYTKAELAVGGVMDFLEEDDGSMELTRLTTDGKRPQSALLFKRRTAGSKVTFDNVTYCLPGRASYPFMTDLSFEVPAGKTLAIAGTYKDKTAFLNLIMRFYDVSVGSILIDDKNIHDIDMAELRESIGYVPQKSDLFESSITENILYGYRGTTGDEIQTKALVRQVVQTVGLEQFIDKHPLQYDTIVDENCIGMTEVVRRRIMFARALVRNPKILLLDEPTEGLPLNEEMEMLNLVKSVKGGRTCIVTTTKGSLAKIADLVGMFQSGNMVQFGTNQKLAAEGGPFSAYNSLTDLPPLPAVYRSGGL